MALAFCCRPRHVLGTAIPFRRDRTPRGYSREIWWVGKVFPDFDPYRGLSFYDRAFVVLASPTFLEPPPVAGVRSRIGSSLRLSSLKRFFR